MSEQQIVVVPRHNRDEPIPPAPLDTYVTALVRWIASAESGVLSNTLVRQIAAAFDWPPPFAEAVVTAAKGRRLLTQIQTGATGGQRSMLSMRGRAWLNQTESAGPTTS